MIQNDAVTLTYACLIDFDAFDQHQLSNYNIPQKIHTAAGFLPYEILILAIFYCQQISVS
jgi:hypothetical protein